MAKKTSATTKTNAAGGDKKVIVPATEPDVKTQEVKVEACVQATTPTEAATILDNSDKSGDKAQGYQQNYRVRYDYDTGLVLLRVSSTTDYNKLATAIVKHFKDGAKALVVSFIGHYACMIALKGVCLAQKFVSDELNSEKALSERLGGKEVKLAIVPDFHSFVNTDEGSDNPINTLKFTLRLIRDYK